MSILSSVLFSAAMAAEPEAPAPVEYHAVPAEQVSADLRSLLEPRLALGLTLLMEKVGEECKVPSVLIYPVGVTPSPFSVHYEETSGFAPSLRVTARTFSENEEQIMALRATPRQAKCVADSLENTRVALASVPEPFTDGTCTVRQVPFSSSPRGLFDRRVHEAFSMTCTLPRATISI